MTPWLVRIGGNGHMIEDVVFAKCAKHALQASIANIPEGHPAFGWAGWTVEVGLLKEPFIVGAILKGKHDR